MAEVAVEIINGTLRIFSRTLTDFFLDLCIRGMRYLVCDYFIVQ